MATPSYVESLVCSAKRLRISRPTHTPTICSSSQRRFLSSSSEKRAATSINNSIPTSSNITNPFATPSNEQGSALRQLRLPKAVQAVFLAPLKRSPTHGIPVCDLQIRSYSVRNLEVFTDFCLRAAYYLKLPARGPVHLPRIVERWTVPKSHFIFKKSQENFERKTLRRLVQIQDGHHKTVALWLAYIQKHRYYGVGMKANIYEHGPLDVTKEVEAETERLRGLLGAVGESYDDKNLTTLERQAQRLLEIEPFKAQWGGDSAMLKGASQIGMPQKT